MKCETMTKLLTKGSSGRQKLSKSVNNLYNCMQNDPHFAVSSKLQYFIYTRNQALWAWILEFEMSVHRICKFDPFWTDLIQKKSKNKMAIFILFKNVTTFYTNIFWYVQPLRSFFLQKYRHSETARAQTSPLK